MKPKLKSSPAARDLIERYEPFHDNALQGEDGRWVVGFGHRAAAKAGVTVSRDEAKLLLIYDIMQAEEAINGVISSELTRPQRDALVSFVHGIGIPAFKQSDVARYLFEGRAMAAGEAVALYGDGDATRREAESALFLSAFAPKKKPKADLPESGETVELVIRVEHPEDTAAAAAEASTAANPELAPPPPPTSRETVFRRDAEDEVARIIASVGAGQVEAFARPGVSDTTSAAAAQTVAEPDIESGDEPKSDLDGLTADLLPAAVPTPVTDRPLVIESEPETAVEEEPVLEAVIEPSVDLEPEPETAHDVATNDTPELEDEAEIVDSIDDELPETAATSIELDAVLAPVEMVDEPEADTVESTNALPTDDLIPEAATDDVAPAPSGPATNTTAARVIARMTQEMAGAPVRVDEPEAGLAHDSADVADLPAGTSLGYVLAGEMATGLDAGADEDIADPVVEQVVDQVEAPVEAPIDETANLDREISDLAAAMAAEPAEDPVEAAVADSAVEPPAEEPQAKRFIAPSVLLTPIAVAGDKTPPPHPAELPATSVGAVGDVMGEPVEDQVEGEASVSPQDDRPMVDDLLAEDHDPLEAGEFSPQDLAGADAVYVAPRDASQEDHGFAWGFFGVFVLGTAAAAIGGWDVAGDWSRIWAEKNIPVSGWVMIAGAIVAGFGGATLILDFVRSRRQKKLANSTR
jgi:GH24 family phage-related lysozyme (muramidase)